MTDAMYFISTRGQAPPVRFSEAIAQGLAPDGGLYVPATWPRFAEPDGPDWVGLDYVAFARRLLEPFLVGDPLAAKLGGLCDEAFTFPVPLVEIGSGTALLELYHGPTAAFKDLGARFLAASFVEQLREGTLKQPLLVLVATSGDTGAAVAAACHGRAGIEVGVLFPDGGVSPRQLKQLTCWDDNVQSFAVRGTFDDCQRLTKELFATRDWPTDARLTSANSINIGRLLPQVVYAARAAAEYRAAHGVAPGFVVPSGNLGDVLAVFWAKRLGFPVGEIVIATNANATVPDWFASGVWRPRPALRTLANAMDVGDPSNMERLLALFAETPSLREGSSAVAVDDSTIRETIRGGEGRWGQLFCPHTATAIHARAQIDSPHWIVLATAHPAKFHEIVEPLVDHPVAVPPALSALLDRPTQVVEIDATVEAFKRAWR